ncbi:NADH-quinone oxidoreductase subunit A [Microbispora cellulosiformans]|uniref:NADH-quinone oxidoreductase subunit n=1 Tax=Microbispora cellulosiformans TaxID=2614688 RepID=A0A5J5JW49_9ACTN|nr:NADH-quinone oxidoreductase subunit A [Microbispora cellulosiformans]KAA9375507.1 NADH-quinone oxidoreductase subunit A [Microbispora cellulosiformans]
MEGWSGIAGLLVLLLAGMTALHAVAVLVRLPGSLEVEPFLSGERPQEHALSRYHVRWYAVALLFLAFDMEMVFMYPWAVVVTETGGTALAEMFVFLALLLVGVAYAWREGAFRWA